MSPRNNQDRVGAKEKNTDAPIAQSLEETKNRLFNFSVPTEFVDLPSQGRFYPEGHPLHGKDSVEIRYMTAKDEDILTSQSLLKKGIAIDRLLQNIIVDKSVNPDDMLSGDRNAVLIASRITGYGAEYATKVGCPSCNEVVEQVFDISELEANNGGPREDMGVEETGHGLFSVKLPKLELTVEFRLLTGADEKAIMFSTNKKKKHKLPVDDTLTQQLRAILISVEGHRDSALLDQLVQTMPAFDARILRTAVRTVTPDIDMKTNFTCSDCDYEGELGVPLTAEFFWPQQ